MIEDYLTTIRLMFHFALFVEAVLCAYIFLKVIIGKKHSKIFKISSCFIVAYSLFYAFVEADFIYSFFEVLYSEAYDIIATFSQVLFTGIFISTNMKGANNG